MCNPIIDWDSADVWDYIASEHLSVNPLYQCGFQRVGCIGCPMARHEGRTFEFERYPTYRAAYIRAFDRMLAERRRKGRTGVWDTGDYTGLDIFHWWMEDGVPPPQAAAEDMEDDDE